MKVLKNEAFSVPLTLTGTPEDIAFIPGHNILTFTYNNNLIVQVPVLPIEEYGDSDTGAYLDANNFLHITRTLTTTSFVVTLNSGTTVVMEPVLVTVIDPTPIFTEDSDRVKRIQTPEATVELHDPLTIIKARERSQTRRPSFCDSHVCIANPIF